jgi:peroxiredoxin
MRHQIASHEEWIKARRKQWDNGRCAEMIASAPNLIDSDAAPLRERPNASADCLLSLAAAPTFAIMALLTGIHGGSMPDMLCSAAGNGLPLSGMFYVFDTETGQQSLRDLFAGRSQLLVYHFMFGPDYKAGCPSCSVIADGFNGVAVHLANHDVMLWAVSRAPLAKLQAYKRRMGWTFPWASSRNNDFNFDFNVSFTEEQQRKGGIEYNYKRGGHAMDAASVPEPVRQFAASVGPLG